MGRLWRGGGSREAPRRREGTAICQKKRGGFEEGRAGKGSN